MVNAIEVLKRARHGSFVDAEELDKSLDEIIEKYPKALLALEQKTSAVAELERILVTLKEEQKMQNKLPLTRNFRFEYLKRMIEKRLETLKEKVLSVDKTGE